MIEIGTFIESNWNYYEWIFFYNFIGFFWYFIAFCGSFYLNSFFKKNYLSQLIHNWLIFKKKFLKSFSHFLFPRILGAYPELMRRWFWVFRISFRKNLFLHLFKPVTSKTLPWIRLFNILLIILISIFFAWRSNFSRQRWL